MPLPLIIGAAALSALGVGAKKAFDGYESHSQADAIIEQAKKSYDASKAAFDERSKVVQGALTKLGTLELEVGKKFDELSTLADRLLEQFNQGRENKLTVNLPKYQLEKVEHYKFTALGVLGSAAAAGAGGAVAGFAIYGGVMALGAASTGTAIASLSGVAATNATLAAIGGGALSAGGLGIAGGTAILGAAVAAPVLAIAAWAYASHGEDALDNAKKASREASAAMAKLDRVSSKLSDTYNYIERLHSALSRIYEVFLGYHGRLHEIDLLITSSRSLIKDDAAIERLLHSTDDETMRYIDNSYKLATIMTDVISTPLFKFSKVVTDSNGVPVIEKDGDGVFVLNQQEIDEAIVKGKTDSDAIGLA